MINNNNPSSREAWAEAEADRQTDTSQWDVNCAVETIFITCQQGTNCFVGKTEHYITFGSSIYFHNTS